MQTLSCLSVYVIEVSVKFKMKHILISDDVRLI